MNEDRIYQLLRLEQSNMLDAEQAKELLTMREAHGKDVEDIEQVLRISKDLVFTPDSDIDQGWSNVMRELESTQQPITTAVTPSARRRLLPSFLAIAASLLVVSAIFFLLPQSAQTLTAETKTEQFDLADGSKVAANINSSAIIDAKFGKKVRALSVKGEVYIDAAKKPMPMHVISEQFQIRVLGTRFNVMDYASDNICSVTLYEGAISLTLPNGEQIDMNSGDHVCWNKKKKSINKSSIQHNMPAWTQNRTAFDNATLDEIFARLERQHGVSFAGKELVDDLHLNYPASKDDLDAILTYIQTATGTTIEKADKTDYTIRLKD